MRKFTFWVLILLTALSGQLWGQVAGDIAFLGVNSDDPDDFAILVRNALAASATFYITDGGITGAGGVASAFFRSTEGFMQYTAPAGGVPANTVLYFVASPASVSINGGGTAGTVALLMNNAGPPNNTSFSFSTSGDQLSAYTVASGDHLTGTPTLLAFMNYGTNPYGGGNANTTDIPTITGGQVLDLPNQDNATVTITNLSAATSIADLSDAANFVQSASLTYDLTTLLASPLPVELTTFTGTAAASAIYLAWATASEQNSARFVIERSATNTPFEAIGEQQAAGNSSSFRDYAFTDVSPAAGINSYRLRQFDTDGAEHLSNTIEVAYAPGLAMLALAPNPAAAGQRLSILGGNATQEITLTLTSAEGKEVSRMVLPASIRTATVPALPAGVYLYTLMQDGDIARGRLVLE